MEYIPPVTNMPMPQLSSMHPGYTVSPFEIRKLSDNRISCPHWHDTLQIWYTVSGEYSIKINGKDYRQTRGSAALIFPYMLHQIDSSKTDIANTNVFQISFKKGILEDKCIPFLSHSFQSASFDSFYLSPVVNIQGQDRNLCDMLCQDMMNEYMLHSAMNVNKISCAVARFLELCIKNTESSISKKELITIREKNNCLDKVFNHILKFPTSQFSIDEASKLAMMSRRTFTSNFKEVTGQTFSDYCTRLQLDHANSLLTTSEMTITEIAEASGFSSASAYIRTCRRICGDSPLVLRKKLSKWSRDFGDKLFYDMIKRCGDLIIVDDSLLESHWCTMSFY